MHGPSLRELEKNMEKKIATHLAYTAVKVGSQLTGLIPIIRKSCDEEQYRRLVISIAKINAEISTQILKQIFDNYPDLEMEIADNIKEYGVMLS